MPPLLQLQKNYRGKVMEGGQKVYLRVVVALFFVFCFLLVGGGGGGGLTKDPDFVGKMLLGASYSTSDKLLLVARHTLTTGLQKCL